MSVEFKDFSMQVKGAMNDACIAFLHEAAGEIQSQTQRNTRVDTGATKNSFSYVLDADKLEATIGSPEENAIWEEFGTGEYALNGDGRKGGWFYEDDEGNGYFTHGKKPSRAMQKAYNKLKNPIKKKAEEVLKGNLGK